VIQDSHYADIAAVERASAALTALLNTGRAVADLGCVEQTLLIPLAARALARPVFPNQGFADPAAEAIAARLACDLSLFEADRDMLWGLIEGFVANSERRRERAIPRQSVQAASNSNCSASDGCGLRAYFACPLRIIWIISMPPRITRALLST
jgi:hypothetical protein